MEKLYRLVAQHHKFLFFKKVYLLYHIIITLKINPYVKRKPGKIIFSK